MRILVVTTWFPSRQRPTEAPFNLEHVKAIQRGHDVQVLHVRLGRSQDVESGQYEGIPVTRIGLDPRRPLTLVRAVRQISSALHNADVLHTMAFSSALVAALPWSVRRRPWVHTEHWNGVTNPESVGGIWPRVAWLRHVLRLPHHVTGVTRQLADKLSEFSRPQAASVVPCVVPNGRPVAPYPPLDPLRLVAVGGLIPRKRPLLAVQTVGWLRGQGHNVQLEWAGDGGQRAEVEALIASSGLSPYVRLLGNVAPAEVFALFDHAHLFFLPTEQENFFTSAAEAMSAGRPVVAPHVGGYDDYATWENSRLVDDVTPESLGRAILDVRDRFQNAEPAVIAEPIRRRFSPETVAGLFDDIYTDVSARRAGGRRIAQ